MSALLEAERDFLLARLTRYDTSDWVGVSSNEMLRVAITGERIHGFSVPHDEDDLGRCEETYRRAPEHLKPALLPILKGFRLLVAEHRQRPGSYTLGQATAWAEDAIRRAAWDSASTRARGSRHSQRWCKPKAGWLVGERGTEKRYEVERRTTYYEVVEVEAKDKRQARDRVLLGVGDEQDASYVEVEIDEIRELDDS